LLESVAIGTRKGHVMREKLNENPKAQVALIAILVVVGAFMFMKMSSGGEEEGEEAAVGGEVAATVNGVPATGATPGEAVENAVESLETDATASVVAAVPASVPAPPLPRRLLTAYDANKTVALLIVHKGSIDSALSARFSRLLAPYLHKVALYVVPAKQIARYAAITASLEVNRVPALVVMTPKRLSHGTPQATVNYGIQTPESVLQAVLDADYRGRERTYHPE
jgi:hypothetical protein